MLAKSLPSLPQPSDASDSKQSDQKGKTVDQKENQKKSA
jgi:HemY protein